MGEGGGGVGEQLVAKHEGEKGKMVTRQGVKEEAEGGAGDPELGGGY